jgi:hypothetical protein
MTKSSFGMVFLLVLEEFWCWLWLEDAWRDFYALVKVLLIFLASF